MRLHKTGFIIENVCNCIDTSSRQTHGQTAFLLQQWLKGLPNGEDPDTLTFAIYFILANQFIICISQLSTFVN